MKRVKAFVDCWTTYAGAKRNGHDHTSGAGFCVPRRITPWFGLKRKGHSCVV
jgi:hypothetical protein